MKKYKLEITVFLCGALIMMLELVAARILSPYVGSSSIVWTTIIGIILVCMSLGYWFGGKIADKNQNINNLSVFILIAAITTSIIPIAEVVVIDKLASISENLILVSVIATTVVFGIPSFMLATCSPIAVKIKSMENEQVGKVSGKISSLSTIGSITGTFVSGFILIPLIGVNSIVIAITAMLVILSVMLYQGKNIKYITKNICVLIILIGLIIYGDYLFKNSNPDILQDVDSQYSRIWVKELSVNENKYKTLQVDTGVESYIDANTGEMGAKYLYYYDLFEYYSKDAKSALLIGGAAYTYPMHYLEKFPGNTMDVVEIDDKMTELAEKEFGLDVNNSNLDIHHQDGRSFLNYNEEKYDVVFMDAFKGINVPFELATYEAMLEVYRNLNENGMIITNVVSALKGNDSKLIEYEYATYMEVFDNVKLFKVKDGLEETEIQNLILIGFKGNNSINEEKINEYAHLLNLEIVDFETEKKPITDHFAPIY